MDALTVQIRQRGVLTLPARLREKYRLDEGDAVTIMDLNGILLLSPKTPLVPKLAAEARRLTREAGLTLNDLLAELPRQRRLRGRQRAPK